MSGKGQITDTAAVGRSIKPVAVSVAIGIAVCTVVLFLLSVVVTTQNIPQSMIDPMALFAMAVGAFVAGMVCAKVMRANGLAYGAICGVVMSLIVLFVGAIVTDGGFGLPGLFRVIFTMLPAMLGGVLGVNTRRRRR